MYDISTYSRYFSTLSTMMWCGPLILFVTLIIRIHSCNAHRPDRDHFGPVTGWSNIIKREGCYRRSEDDIRCPIGGNWSYYNGTNRCYKHVAMNMTWAEARRSCETRGAELASVCDEATNNFLANLTSDPVWIGGYKKWNRWTWSDGTPWGFTAWKDGGFNYPFSESYLAMNFNGKSLWTDHLPKGFLKAGFICQYKEPQTGEQLNLL